MNLIEDVEVDGIKCQLHCIPTRKKMLLDSKVIRVIGPIMGGLAGLTPEMAEKEIDPAFISGMFNRIGEALASLPDYEYEALLNDLLSSVTAIVPGKAPVQLDAAGIDTALRGYGTKTVYQILMAVLKFNKFLPFDLGGLALSTGNGTKATAG